MPLEPSITVPFVTLPGFPVEGLDETGKFTATVKMRCAWGSRLLLALQLKGTYIDATSNTVVLPAKYMPGQSYVQDPATYARCKSVEIRPYFDPQIVKDLQVSSGAVSFASYQWAELTAVYAIDWECYQDPAATRILRHQVDFSSEVLSCETTDQSPLYYVSDNSTVAAVNRPSTLIASCVWTLTIENIGRGAGSAGLDGELQLNAGNVNTAAVTAPFLPYTNFINYPEQILFQGHRLEPFWSPDGQKAWTAVLTLAVKILPTATNLQGGWNHFFKPGAAYSERITQTSGSSTPWKPFPLFDMQGMLTSICNL